MAINFNTIETLENTSAYVVSKAESGNPFEGFDVSKINNITSKIRFATNTKVSSTEVAFFAKEYGYTDISLLEQMQFAPDKVLYHFDNYRSRIDGSLERATDIVCSVVSLPSTIIGRIDRVLDKLRSLDLSSMIGNLMTSIGEAVSSFIDTLVEDLKQRIDNFISAIKSVFDGIKHFAIDSVQFINRKIEDVKNFFSEENVSSLKDRIKNTMDAIVSQFEESGESIVDFLSYHLCKTNTEMEKVLQGKVDDLAKIRNNIQSSKDILRDKSASASKVALVGGRKIPTTESVIDECMIYNESSTDGTRNYTYEPSIMAKPNYREWSNLRFSPSVVSNSRNPNGYNNCRTDVLEYANELAKELGLVFTVNSAYRSPSYNASIGGASRSFHMSGKALDITFSPFNRTNIERVLVNSTKYNFRGRGVYSSFIHIDIGNARGRLSYPTYAGNIRVFRAG